MRLRKLQCWTTTHWLLTFLNRWVTLWGNSRRALLSRYQTHPPTEPVTGRQRRRHVEMAAAHSIAPTSKPSKMLLCGAGLQTTWFQPGNKWHSSALGLGQEWERSLPHHSGYKNSGDYHTVDVSEKKTRHNQFTFHKVEKAVPIFSHWTLVNSNEGLHFLCIVKITTRKRKWLPVKYDCQRS